MLPCTHSGGAGEQKQCSCCLAAASRSPLSAMQCCLMSASWQAVVAVSIPCSPLLEHLNSWPLCRQEKYGEIVLPDIAKGQDGRVSEQLCAAAVELANALDASAIFVYTRRGYMANFLSRCRPDAPIFAFTGQPPADEHPAAGQTQRNDGCIQNICMVHLSRNDAPPAWSGCLLVRVQTARRCGSTSTCGGA
jgi:Pyruvate kinase, alpha/beta domain